LHFACGGRALAECGRAQQRVDEMVRALTCHPDELAERCAALLASGKAAHKELAALRAELATLHATAWVAEAPRAAGVPLVVREVEGAEPEVLGPAAAAIVGQGGIALLGLRGERAHLLCMRPEAVGVDLRPALQAATALLDGKGGGRPDRVQGSGPRAAALADALAAARAEVLRQLGSG
jgi:alanyl-tRNA synthetase